MVNITIHFSNGSHLDFSLLKSKLQYILARSIILLAEIAIFLSSWINPNLNCYKQNSKSDEILVSAPTYIHAKQVCPSCDWWVYWVYSKAVCSLLGLQQSCLHNKYWAVQWSWFAQVNALHNLSRKKSWEVAVSFPGRFMSRRCFTLCITMEVEPRFAGLQKCL